jgi:hypothetical protein
MNEKFPFWIAIILGILAIFGHGLFEMIFPSSGSNFVPENQIFYLLFLTPFFAINFLGFGFTKKKIALTILGISFVVLFFVLISR